MAHLGFFSRSSSSIRNEVLKNVKFIDNTCPVCAKRFKRKDHVQRHFLELHAYKVVTEMGYNCPNCRKLFKRKYLMDHHKKHCNGSDRRFFCPKCAKQFTRKDHLTRHKLEQHTGVVTKHACEFCGRYFKRRYHLSRHMQKCTLKKESCNSNLSNDEDIPINWKEDDMRYNFLVPEMNLFQEI
ncbi:hypothetical protein WA026_023243 [Henosepilachna vigintioctopunctata]|uniref:C2H2-type domain-containing protein n=1 Tax=Henosepilachna vigintioctopunctata TaxID=420089 RepID=A0AAW1VCA8_9CUCU